MEIQRRISLGLLKSLLWLSLALPEVAVAAISVTPVTWNVVGLDSNNVSAGPNVFPVGARVCNTAGSATSAMTARFTWSSANVYINLDSADTVSIPGLSAYACQDVYFDIAVTRNSAAYDQTRQYVINVYDAADVGYSTSLGATPTPREIYAEHLVSQNRNGIDGVSIDGNPVSAGGNYNINVGQTYEIALQAHTATQGYEQFEQFLTLSNNAFRVNRVTSTYTANAGTDANAGKKIYADGCGWNNDPASGTYRECSSTGKYGGTTTLKYSVTVLPAAAGTTQALQAMLYDFSGSSYHYNSDFGSANFNLVVSSAPAGTTDLAITKAVDNSAPVNGGPIQFTLTVKNNGVDNATGVVVTDTVPAGYDPNSWGGSGLSASQGSVTYVGQAITWNVGNLISGASATLVIKVKANTNGPYLNTATVSGNEGDPDISNNSASSTILTTNLGADVAVAKTVDKSITQVGDTVHFTITATNLGPSGATGVVVADALPTGYTLVSSTPSVGTYSGGLWTIGNLANGASASLDITATVNASGTFLNTATVTTTSADPNATNDSATASAAPSFLGITKTPTSTYVRGASGTFDMVVTKSGDPADLGTITVQDVAPMGMTITSMSGAGWTCTTLQCTRSDVVGTGTYPSIAVNVDIDAAAPSSLVNYASVSGGSSYAETTALVTVYATPPAADLAVTKTVSSSTPLVGSDVTFTITATNNGGDAATGVSVSEVLQSGYALVSSTPSVGTYAGGVWTIGNLANGASETLSIVATVLASGSYSNTAAISGNETDPNGANDTSTVVPTPTVPPQADLAVTKVVSNTSPKVGSNVTFTITATNNGSGAATGVSVSDVLQSGYALISSTPSVGTYAGGVWTIGNLANGATATLSIVATVLPSGTYSNTAVISGNEADPNGANDTSSVVTTPAATTPKRIPTLSEWSMIVLSSLLALAGARVLHGKYPHSA